MRIIIFHDFLVVEKLTIIIFNEMNQLWFPSPPAPVTPCNKAINRGSNEALKDHYINILNNSEHTTKQFCIFPQKTLASHLLTPLFSMLVASCNVCCTMQCVSLNLTCFWLLGSVKVSQSDTRCATQFLDKSVPFLD